MNKYLNTLIKSILSGFCIVIGVTIYLSMLSFSKILGATFFCLGLFTIIHFKFDLYTGKVGSTLDNKPKFILDLLVCLIGNFIGVISLTSLLKLTRLNPTLTSQAIEIVNTKQNDNWYSIFILSIMCGVMIYVAVKGHALCPYEFGKVIFAFLPIIVFIMCGYEHCIANAAYYTYAGIFNLKALGYFCLMIIGNGIGAIGLDFLIKICDKLKTNQN